MVLYKRKQVTFVRPLPVPQDLDSEIYVIPQTKEWFLDYSDYLARMDYYHRRKFVCEITGNSCLTYFEAHLSESKEIKDLDAHFPEALREHILKFLQFNRISRLDLLVDKVYSVFKNEYFPGEEVYVKKIIEPNANRSVAKANAVPPHAYMSTVKQRAMIREKVQYSDISETKYLVSTIGDGSQIIATNQQISRDRNHFTKWLIKTYIKLTVTRSQKVGAPWVVKEKYAKKYRIPTEFPEDLKMFEHITPSGEVSYEGDEISESFCPASDASDPNSSKSKKVRGKAMKKKAASNLSTVRSRAGTDEATDELVAIECMDPKAKLKSDPRSRFPLHHLPESIQKELNDNELVTLSSFQPSKKTITEDLDLGFDLQNTRPPSHPMKLLENALSLNEQSLEREEDESDEESMKKDSVDGSSLQLHKRDDFGKLLLSSSQEALEIWTFLNIYHSVFKLDTFTFDDFICAMGWNDDQYKDLGRCELLDETWCAVLSLIISNEPVPKKYLDEAETYGLRISLPPKVTLLKPGQTSEATPKDSKDDSESDDMKVDEVKDESKENGEIPDESNEKHGTEENEIEENKESEENHLAYSVINHRGVAWHERLRKRNFKDGGWQVIVLGVLSLVEYVPEYSAVIREAYEVLAPLSVKPATPGSVLSQFYTYLSIDLRLKILHILTTLVVNGDAVRAYIDEALEASTNLRRSRLEILKDMKSAVDNANKAHSEIHNKLLEGSNSAIDPSIWNSFSRKKHRLNMRGYEMTEYEKAYLEVDPSFQEVWDEREASIAKIQEMKSKRKEIESKLSELDCQRVRLLGKDRHFNRYWWFENNGLPNIHFNGGEDEDEVNVSDEDLDDKEEVLEETYLMGRLWMQGPTSMDLTSNLKLSEEEAKLISKNSLQYELAMTQNIDKIEKGDREKITQQLNSEDGGQALKVMNFQVGTTAQAHIADVLGLQYTESSIRSKDDSVLIDDLGGLSAGISVKQITPMQRKSIEEFPVPLVLGNEWRYFDKPNEIEALLKWLNPWGKRESALRKELQRVKDGICASMSARRKALWFDELPKEEATIEEKIQKAEEKIDTLSNIIVEETELEDSGDDILAQRKRPNRRAANGSNKRQKTVEETLNSGTVEEVQKLRDELRAEKHKKVGENQVNRVLEWVNRSARDEFDKSLYEGGDKAKTKGKKAKK